jgi:hypothetical protein
MRRRASTENDLRKELALANTLLAAARVSLREQEMVLLPDGLPGRIDNEDDLARLLAGIPKDFHGVNLVYVHRVGLQDGIARGLAFHSFGLAAAQANAIILSESRLRDLTLAHEFGHLMGLPHVTGDQSNLLSSALRESSGKLTTAQVQIIRREAGILFGDPAPKTPSITITSIWGDPAAPQTLIEGKAAGLPSGASVAILVHPTDIGAWRIGQSRRAGPELPPLGASCSISPSPIALGQGAQVSASASAGIAPYRFSLNGRPYGTVEKGSVLATAAPGDVHLHFAVYSSSGQPARTSFADDLLSGFGPSLKPELRRYPVIGDSMLTLAVPRRIAIDQTSPVLAQLTALPPGCRLDLRLHSPAFEITPSDTHTASAGGTIDFDWMVQPKHFGEFMIFLGMEIRCGPDHASLANATPVKRTVRIPEAVVNELGLSSFQEAFLKAVTAMLGIIGLIFGFPFLKRRFERPADQGKAKPSVEADAPAGTDTDSHSPTRSQRGQETNLEREFAGREK